MSKTQGVKDVQNLGQRNKVQLSASANVLQSHTITSEPEGLEREMGGNASLQGRNDGGMSAYCKCQTQAEVATDLLQCELQS